MMVATCQLKPAYLLPIAERYLVRRWRAAAGRWSQEQTAIKALGEGVSSLYPRPVHSAKIPNSGSSSTLSSKWQRSTSLEAGADQGRLDLDWSISIPQSNTSAAA